MNKKNWIIICIVLVLLIGLGIFFFVNTNSSDNTDTNTYEINKTSTSQDNNSSNQNSNNIDNTKANNNQQNPNQQYPEPKEEQIATFSTKIYDQDSARQNNINITCNTLNGTILKNGDTFSFCNTVGQATSNKGYQEADIFDRNGQKKKGLGGR